MSFRGHSPRRELHQAYKLVVRCTFDINHLAATSPDAYASSWRMQRALGPCLGAEVPHKLTLAMWEQKPPAGRGWCCPVDRARITARIKQLYGGGQLDDFEQLLCAWRGVAWVSGVGLRGGPSVAGLGGGCWSDACVWRDVAWRVLVAWWLGVRGKS